VKKHHHKHAHHDAKKHSHTMVDPKDAWTDHDRKHFTFENGAETIDYIHHGLRVVNASQTMDNETQFRAIIGGHSYDCVINSANCKLIPDGSVTKIAQWILAAFGHKIIEKSQEFGHQPVGSARGHPVSMAGSSVDRIVHAVCMKKTKEKNGICVENPQDIGHYVRESLCKAVVDAGRKDKKRIVVKAMATRFGYSGFFMDGGNTHGNQRRRNWHMIKEMVAGFRDAQKILGAEGKHDVQLTIFQARSIS